MKKLLLSFLLGFVFIMPLAAVAIDLGDELVNEAASQAGYDSATNEQTFAELIGTVIKTVLSFVGVIFLALMVYAGYLWMTAKGEESQIEKAQDIIRSSVIGLVIMVGAYSITAFVVPRIVEKTTGDTAPTAGGENVLCCVVCPAHSDAPCDKIIVNSENECMAKDGCPNNPNNNVENSCSVIATPGKQCGKAIIQVSCCIIEKPDGSTEKRKVGDEDQCAQICDRNNQGGFGIDVDIDWSCDTEVLTSDQCQ